MANNYGSLEGTMDANGILGGEIQFNGAGGRVKDVQVNDVSVVDANGIAKIDLTDYAKTEDIPADLADLQDDETHRLVTDAEKTEWSGKSNVSANPSTTTETLTGIEIDGTAYAIPSGDVKDVKVDGTSVVDTVTKEANIDLTGYAEKTDIHNPTITIQKNGQNVDTFTLNQTANKVIDISVPTKTSDLQNDSSFITNTVNNLANYYLKTQTYTQTEVDALIDAAVNGRFRKVTVLPATGEPNIIYLVPKATPETSNACDEYIWQDNDWELIGSTNIDLSGYVTDDELTTALADYLTTSAFNTAIANYYTKTEVGNLLDDKVDKVSGKGLSTNDYDNTAKGIVDGVTNALAGKVDKVNGKGLSTEDYTTTEKNKLAGISTNANKVEASTTNGNIKIDSVETPVYDGSGKADKVSSATNGNLAGLNGQGNPTDSGWNGAKDTTSISGNPISIPNLKANQLAKNPIITLEPIQAGSGTPSPSNIRAISGYDKIEVLSAGINLLAPTPYSGSYNMAVDSDLKITANMSSYTQNADGITVHVGTAWHCRTFATGILKAGTTYKFYVNNGDNNVRMTVYLTDENLIIQQNLGNIQAGGTSQVNITATQRSRVAVTITKNVAGDENCKSLMVFEGTTLPAYEPYVKTTSISESLGQMVYGGTLDVRTGKFTATLKGVDLGSLDYTRASSSGVASFRASVTGKAYNNFNMLCDTYSIGQNTSFGTLVNYELKPSSASDIIAIRNDDYSDADVFATAMSGHYLVFELATPTEIQLTPHEISLLKDYAYVSTNGTNIALAYHNGELASLADVAQLNESVENKDVIKTFSVNNVFIRKSQKLTVARFNSVTANESTILQNLANYFPTDRVTCIVADYTSKKPCFVNIAKDTFKVYDIASWTALGSYNITGQAMWIE